MTDVQPSTDRSPTPRQTKPLPLRLVGLRWAAENTYFLDFALADGGRLPPATAGAHIDVALPNGLMRQYSLLTIGDDLNTYTVGVKRDAGSRGGSALIHEQLRVGAMLEVGGPRNNFELDESAPHTVLIAGGIGITPIYAMANRLIALGSPFTLHYACRTRGEAPFVAELEVMEQASLHFDDEQGGAVLDIAAIVAAAPDGAHFYCCGPGPMLQAFEQACAAVPAERVHVEYFAPKVATGSDVRQGGFKVTLARSGLSVEVADGRSILEAVREAGIDVPSSCEVGICGTCETRVISGTPDHRDSLLSDAEKEAGATMMICCSGSKTPELVLDL